MPAITAWQIPTHSEAGPKSVANRIIGMVISDLRNVCRPTRPRLAGANPPRRAARLWLPQFAVAVAAVSAAPRRSDKLLGSNLGLSAFAPGGPANPTTRSKRSASHDTGDPISRAWFEGLNVLLAERFGPRPLAERPLKEPSADGRDFGMSAERLGFKTSVP
jgi:hypothetical protein